MDTAHTSTTQDETTAKGGNILDRWSSEFIMNRYAISSAAFLVIGIMGGYTVGVSIDDGIWQIGAVAGFTMLALSLMLAVAPMKYIIRATLLALAVDLLLIFI